MSTLYAVSDLHVSYAENRRIVDGLRPGSPDDWLIVAGDVAELLGSVEATLRLLRERFAKVIWAPGNHELWTHRDDPVQLRGVRRYERLVEMCREIDVLTPEDDYAVWHGAGGPAAVAPLFLLYDYSFRAPGTTTKQESLAYAYRTGVVCTDEQLLHPDPYPDRESWCWDRVALTERRLAAIDPALPTVLVSHWPLHRHPTEVLWYPEFAQWCGTERTADWHLRFRAAAAVYGHLHIPRTTWQDGVRFEEVSLGYPREWGARPEPPALPRPILG
ncbi:metallophosphoesterase family protein [Amorphoplanes digitatis]|uniref:3',5'-cyclic AMP phosphodiesterase CpdA n=1 Tax=Actinoplanes digitatis TaxID=1868 RepID=A0A7W7HXY1_9ACTN|nr:metallophosphoesterase [Actinoplanes digitatis]MBB4762746.1 3',5'-cyclic AMP phosphodiesterase CpdA [Actinoplanes digitatis]GID91758.1 metallophosphoesterase [Actinoplanes digitatis]